LSDKLTPTTTIFHHFSPLVFIQTKEKVDFNYQLGSLPWRSLDFDFRNYDQEFKQPCVQINYPNDHEYTRTVEIKHVTAQQAPNTVVSYEYSKATGDPYYPVPDIQNQKLLARYRELAEGEKRNNVYFAGRLAEYRYLNTDEAIERALSVYAEIRNQIKCQNSV
jgi:UDP-galactopyranose mutase